MSARQPVVLALRRESLLLLRNGQVLVVPF